MVGLAIDAQVKQLALFHHDPMHDDAKMDAMIARARELVQNTGASLKVEAAQENAEIFLKASVQV
jgi:phosphoribosyl 1,2-cyclic phosphodiesterase